MLTHHSFHLQAQSLADKSLAIRDKLADARTKLSAIAAEQEAITIVRGKLEADLANLQAQPQTRETTLSTVSEEVSRGLSDSWHNNSSIEQKRSRSHRLCSRHTEPACTQAWSCTGDRACSAARMFTGSLTHARCFLLRGAVGQPAHTTYILFHSLTRLWCAHPMMINLCLRGCAGARLHRIIPLAQLSSRTHS